AHSRLQSLTPAQLDAVEAVTRGLVNKFLHQPLRALKNAAQHGDLAAIEAIRAAFAPNGNRGMAGPEPPTDVAGSDEPALTAKRRND
ncbi:MAG: hypothetical protein JO300_11470, partial [Silvibacterium sp.]|nr:hypothetical protein [Silvibacterium sp.]